MMGKPSIFFLGCIIILSSLFLCSLSQSNNCFDNNIISRLLCDTNTVCCGNLTRNPFCLNTNDGRCCTYNDAAIQCGGDQKCCGSYNNAPNATAYCCANDQRCCSTSRTGVNPCCGENDVCCGGEFENGWCCGNGQTCGSNGTCYNNNNNDKHHKIASGALAGLIIGVVFGLFFLVLLFVCLCCRPKAPPPPLPVAPAVPVYYVPEPGIPMTTTTTTTTRPGTGTINSPYHSLTASGRQRKAGGPSNLGGSGSVRNPPNLRNSMGEL